MKDYQTPTELFSFWSDVWIGQQPLKILFPDIYLMNQQQRATILEVRDNQGWNLSFRRMLNDWEVERLTDFYNTLEQFKDYSTRVDSLVWLKEKQGRFSVKSYIISYIPPTWCHHKSEFSFHLFISNISPTYMKSCDLNEKL